jgi:Carbohydrate binding domain
MNLIWFFYISIVFNGFFQKEDNVIRFDNPSFEGVPQDATTPTGWVTCGENSTPDILPGFWGVNTEASDGSTFVGLTTREDGTWEAIGQKLRKPIKADECYVLSLDLARSNAYAGYNNPIKVKIWGGEKRCKKDQLLAESKLINHNDWKTYRFLLNPKKDYPFITFEAHYASGLYFAYKGNILIDNCSPIKLCPRASL